MRGTHGTSRSNANSIINDQLFKPTTEANGRAGSGVYFWASHEDDPEDAVAKYLAVSWWVINSKRNAYAKDKEPDCAVIGADICKPDDLEYVDATQHKFQNELQQMAITVGPKEFDTGSATSILIRRMESKNNKGVLLLKTMVQTPRRPGKECAVAKNFPQSCVFVIREGGQKLLSNIKIICTD